MRDTFTKLLPKQEGVSRHSTLTLVDESFIEEIIEDYGEDSDQYRVRVKGEFPRAELVDDKGYIPLFNP